MSDTKRNLLIAPVLFLASTAYYYFMSAKIWTWLYVSGDSGDWLLFTNGWTVPQPFGSPLFISAVRLLGWAFPHADPYQLVTFFLSVIPGAVLVVLAYFIALELTKKWQLGLVASLVLLGMSIALAQATVFEQYTFTAVLVSLAYLMYLKKRLAWAVIFIGLGTASHIIVGVIALLWFVIEWERRRELIRLSPLFIVFGILPYGLIFYLLATVNSLFYSGGLSLSGLNVYLGGMYQVGNLSLAAIPRRLMETAATVLAMFGLAIVPLVVGFKRPWSMRDKVALVVIGVMFWFWFSNSFFSTFKYMVIACPILAGYVALGLSKLNRKHLYATGASALVLLSLNTAFMNADHLAKQEPQASDYYNALWNLPDGSAILAPRGGAYGFALFFALSEGKQLIPLLQTKSTPTGIEGSAEVDFVYRHYLDWFRPEYGLDGSDCIELSREAMDKGLDVYFAGPVEGTEWVSAFTMEPTETYGLYEVTDVKVKDWPTWVAQIEAARESK